MLTVFFIQTGIPVRRCKAFELVGDLHTRRSAVLPEQLAHRASGRVPGAPALYQHGEHCAILVYRAPQPVFLPVSRDEHLVYDRTSCLTPSKLPRSGFHTSRFDEPFMPRQGFAKQVRSMFAGTVAEGALEIVLKQRTVIRVRAILDNNTRSLRGRQAA